MSRGLGAVYSLKSSSHIRWDSVKRVHPNTGKQRTLNTAMIVTDLMIFLILYKSPLLFCGFLKYTKTII